MTTPFPRLASSPDDFCPSDEQLLRLVTVDSAFAERDQLLLHLDVCSGCRLVLAETTRMLVAKDGPSGGPSTLTPGERLQGRYEIRRFVACGGMGEVYEAFDELTRTRVALKTITATALDDDGAALRFAAEAKLARRVKHRNVCQLRDFGIHRSAAGGADPARDQSVPFFTMDYLEGETLASRIARHGAVQTIEILPLVHQILAGLGAIHAAGIVHRDLKSENVFLVADADGEERIVLMDFGLARALDGSVLTTLPHLHPRLIGTIECMAPEQIEGDRPAGPLADVYAVGVLLFEILTGRRPFIKVCPTVRITCPPPIPSSCNPALAAWDQVVARCLARRPQDRFPRLDDLLAALPRPSEAQ